MLRFNPNVGCLLALAVVLVNIPAPALAQQNGAVTATETESEAGTDAEAEAESEADAESEAEAETDADAETEAEGGGDAASDAASEADGLDAPLEEGAAAEPEPEEEAQDVAPAGPIRYVLERIEVQGNTSTQSDIVERYVPLEPGDSLDVDDPEMEHIRWRLLGTGFFNDVRLSLSRGSQRGYVVLIVEVEERNTLVVQQIAAGVSQGVGSTTDMDSDLLPYGGLTIGETNLLGTGIGLSASVLISDRQQAVTLEFSDPDFRSTDILFRASAGFRNGLEFFGQDPLVSVDCPEMLDPEDECPPEVLARNAVVLYERYSGSVGIGLDVGTFSRLTLDWNADIIDVGVRPDAASETRGTDVVPINFAVEDGVSFSSSLRLGLVYDGRDQPALTHEGIMVRFAGAVATELIGSDYSFLKAQVLVRHWVPVGRGHIRFGFFGGVIFGDSPFYEQFYAADLSDLIPSRILEMNIDDRVPPNLLGTSIEEMRSQNIAGRLDIEYALPIYRGTGGFRAIEAYFGAGIYALADRDDLRFAIPGYEGLATVPVDLTFDIGLRADTSIGAFQLGFSSILGFLSL